MSLVVWYFLLMLNMGDVDAATAGPPPAMVVPVGMLASAGECTTYRDGLVSKLGTAAYGWMVTDCVPVGPPPP